MSTDDSPATPAPRGRGRGSHKSRGGLGKYLRARGRGRARGGRPAEFRERLVLENEELIELDPDSEEVKTTERKYSKRTLESNASRYEEKDEVDEDGEAIVAPEVDLSSFLERQRLEDAPKLDLAKDSQDMLDNDDIDHSLDHLIPSTKRAGQAAQNRKGKAQAIEWDETLEEMRREKEVVEANRDLKARFRSKAERLKSSPATGGSTLPKKKGKTTEQVEAPPLPTDQPPPPKPEKEKMQDFLDDLLG